MIDEPRCPPDPLVMRVMSAGRCDCPGIQRSGRNREPQRVCRSRAHEGPRARLPVCDSPGHVERQPEHGRHGIGRGQGPASQAGVPPHRHPDCAGDRHEPALRNHRPLEHKGGVRFQPDAVVIGSKAVAGNEPNAADVDAPDGSQGTLTWPWYITTHQI